MTLHGLNRYHAFAIHMAISLIIFFILLVCITQYWYPGILFDTSNGWQAIGLIIGIDLILGPFLTLLVFNPAKSSIKLDLGVIALIQTAALIYGIWTIQSTRPLAIAYVNTSFITFYANAENAENIKSAINRLNTRQLYYVFDDTNPSKTLNPDQFASYAQYANIIATTASPYHQASPKKGSILINIDPLMSGNRFLQVNNITGEIISFYQQPATRINTDSHTLQSALKRTTKEEAFEK